MSKDFEKTVETYEIETELGRDELTIVYRARRKSDDFPVVIRVLGPQFAFDTFFVMRFKDAITRSMQLAHPNIVKVYEVAEKEEIIYIARERVDADSLATYIEKQGALPVTHVINFVKQLASALDYAHAKGIKHGGLSDNSIFIADDHVWITDFGIIMAMDGTSMVKKGFSAGNPVYLSPERVRGEGSSRIADLYALGIVTYQMLTGTPPFLGEAPAVLYSQVYDQPVPPHEVNSKVSEAISNVVLRMLSKGLELRYSTGAEFVVALQATAEETRPMVRTAQTGTVKPTVYPQTKTLVSKQFVFWAFILTPLMGLALAVGFFATSQWLGDLNITTATQVSMPVPVEGPTEAPASITQGIGLTPVPFLNRNVPASADGAASNQADPQSANAFIVDTPLPTATFTPAPAPTPTFVPTIPTPATPISLPSEPVITTSSPFTNLILAKNVNDNFQPVGPTNIFRPSRDPIYLFFDYNAIQVGTSWKQIWRWDDVVLQQNQDVWPEQYGDVGTAWIYFSPAAGFNPGPYSVNLEVEGQVVASIDFVVQ